MYKCDYICPLSHGLVHSPTLKVSLFSRERKGKLPELCSKHYANRMGASVHYLLNPVGR